jgi:chromosome segregation ATPase
MNVPQVVNLLKISNNNISSIERKCQDLKREETSLNARNLDAARTFEQLGSDISEESQILNQYRSSCKEERLELAKLRLQKEKLESVVRQFNYNNESLQRIKELVKQIIEQRLMNHRHVLLIALQSIIDSCRRDPVKFNILYPNLSYAALTTTETRLEKSGMINQYNHGLSTNDQLYYQHENSNDDDVAYSKIIVNVAEQFFNRMIKELEHVCINQIIEAFISGSISPQLTKKSILDSKAVLPVLPIQTNGNEKEDLLP